jgi:anaerobic selenocysteine-containing dehydrogenase
MTDPLIEAPGEVSTYHGTCSLCEANCGITVTLEGDRIRSIRGDEDDVQSRGYICPKAVALADLHEDPDRLRKPLARTATGWQEVGWDEAFDRVASGLDTVQRKHGREAVAVYVGNPMAHNYSALLGSLLYMRILGTRGFYSANSVDSLPRLLTSYLVYGSQALLPIPDIDRTDFMLIIGANPVVSNGSIMTAPDCRRRLKELRERGGRLVVVDPRRTETAELACEHHFITPKADVYFLAALLHVVFAERLDRPTRLDGFVAGKPALVEAVRALPPERVAPACGIAAHEIRRLARAFATAKSAVCYGRVGTCQQEHGTAATWLIDALHVVTGNLDRAGGAMFTRPAVDLSAMLAQIGMSGQYDQFRSRVSGRPEANGELPAATLAEEMETPGPGQVRALLTQAGNPVLSLPNGRRLEQALARLDFMVSVDLYVNETTRHAHVILPPTFGLERDHYPLLCSAMAVRNSAKFSPALFAGAPDSRSDWEIMRELSVRTLRYRGGVAGLLARPFEALSHRLGPRQLLAAALRFGPHGKGASPFGQGLTLETLAQNPHGVDLGALEPRLPEALPRSPAVIRLAPEVLVTDLARAAAKLDGAARAPAAGLVLIGRRQLRSNNSWMHNSARLVSGRPRCTLQMNPGDAAARGLSGGPVELRSRVGAIRVELEITDRMMPGVVSLPHGWGHDRAGTQLRVAEQHAGASLNDVTDETVMDAVSGTASLSGVPVEVRAVQPV